ncbi:MAG: phenylalanine--tRNA ligase subunit beta [Thermoflexales bacterium]
MRVPLSWLREYVEIPLSVDELAERLTLAGLEVEHVERIGVPGSELPWDRDKIFVGEVTRVERHPNADRLLLATVAFGADQLITVVTGAPNLKPGDKGMKVALALKGARLYDGHKEGRVIMTLKEATLRGIKNDSMVCSEKELGLSDDHEGILILPDDAPVGVPLVDYLGDVVLEIAILPNTARCASIIGVARELAALTGQTLRYPSFDFEADGPDVHESVAVHIHDARCNPRFVAGVARGVRLGPSPWWMRRRLTLCGMRPINNVVDISNYVMLELGQPTHAFDLDAVRVGPSGKRTIITRCAQPGERLTTLDGVERALHPEDILVCDELGPLSIAGVMGGAESEVKDNTVNILFETATWDPTHIRRTARRHNLLSEASQRFARGLHPSMAWQAQRRGLSLLQQIAGAQIDRGLCDAYPNPVQPTIVSLRPQRVRHILGVEIPAEHIAQTLRALEFDVQPLSDNTLRVVVPDHRLDVEGEHDLIEEIARLRGYDTLPATLMSAEVPPAHSNPELEFEDDLKDTLVRLGLQEIITYRLTTPEAEAKTRADMQPEPLDAYVALANPLTPDRTVMRRTLLTAMLDTLAANLRHHARVALFEVGNVYLQRVDQALPEEVPRLAIGLAGVRQTGWWQEPAPPTMDFYDLKGLIEALVSAFGVGNVQIAPSQHPSLRPGRAAKLVNGGHVLGHFGELHPHVKQRWDFPPDLAVLVAELDVTLLRQLAETTPRVSDVPRFPPVVEDIAVVVAESVSAEEVQRVIARAGGDLLRAVHLFDVYRGAQIGEGKKSLAWSLTWQADDRTLTDKDTEKLRARVIRALETQLGATVRRS